MMKKTRSIPEWGKVDLNYFRGISNKSTTRTNPLNLLITITFVVHYLSKHSPVPVEENLY